MSELPTAFCPVSLHGGGRQGYGVRKVCHPFDPHSPHLSADQGCRYLQELQKQVEEHRRSPSSTTFDSQKQPGDAAYHSSPTAQAASGPPQYRSPLDIPTIQTQTSLPYCSPPVSQSQLADPFSQGLKRTSDVAFGPSGDVNGECRVDTALASPALTSEGTQQHADPSDPAQVPAFQPTDSPLSIWPSAFTIPSKIIKNTRKNRRTWSECPVLLANMRLTWL